MASDHNLIDFSDASSDSNNHDQQTEQIDSSGTSTTTISSSMAPVASTVAETTDKNVVSSSVSTIASSSKPQNKSNKSLFEITRVESNHGDSVGGEDSEMDDSVSSSTSILEMISKGDKEENSVIKSPTLETTLEVVPQTSSNQQTQAVNTMTITNPVSVTQTTQSQLQTSQVTLQQQVTTTIMTATTTQTSTEPPSRFRIVKIAKPKPYERGTWQVNDFNDTQKQSETAENAPSSPAVKRTRNPLSESGGVTSPTEPIKTKSSEFLAQNVLNAHSRGSSYNTNGDRRSSVESTAVSESGSGAPIVTPMVEALEVALDQIQSIRDSMLVSVSEEMKKLRETLEKIHSENVRLKDENDSLKKKLSAAEDRISALEKG